MAKPTKDATPADVESAGDFGGCATLFSKRNGTEAASATSDAARGGAGDEDALGQRTRQASRSYPTAGVTKDPTIGVGAGVRGVLGHLRAGETVEMSLKAGNQAARPES